MGNLNSYKSRAKKLIDSVGEYKADLGNILAELEELRALCISGIEQEKLSVKDGVMPVTERYPQVALGCIMGKLTVYREIARISEMDEVDPEMSVNIVLTALEDDLEPIENP